MHSFTSLHLICLCVYVYAYKYMCMHACIYTCIANILKDTASIYLCKISLYKFIKIYPLKFEVMQRNKYEK